jgi:excisionase family DNA binding protein
MTPRVQAALAELIEALAEAVRTEAATGPVAPDRLLSIDEAAATLGIGRSALYGLLAEGRLKSCKVGRRRLLASGAIAEYIAEHAAWTALTLVASSAAGFVTRKRELRAEGIRLLNRLAIAEAERDQAEVRARHIAARIAAIDAELIATIDTELAERDAAR